MILERPKRKYTKRTTKEKEPRKYKKRSEKVKAEPIYVTIVKPTKWERFKNFIRKIDILSFVWKRK